MIDILIAEDNYEVRLSLINMLKNDSEFHVIGKADNGFKAVDMAKNLLPDLILMDIKMPGLDGLRASKQIKEFCAAIRKDIKILILSTFYDDAYVLKSQACEVDGYLLKGLTFDKLAAAIKNTCSGFVTLDRVIYEKQSKLKPNGTSSNAEFNILTKPELSILELIVKGKTNAEIASELFFSKGTVRNYISSMLSKLGCKNSRDLTVLGIKAGL